MPAIRFSDIHKVYSRGKRRVEALRGVRLVVEEGESFGLLGRNGAGKTSLVKILLDLVHATRGSAQLFGRDSSQAEARRPVGYLPEDHQLPDYRTGPQSLEFYARLSHVPRAERRRRIGEVLELVDLSHAVRQKVRTYSKGMRQRLGLAQALLHRPRLLILDEPTDGVDPVGRAAIRTTLERLREEQVTLFLNSHLLSEVEQICSRVAMLEEGQLVREGTIADLTHVERVFILRTAQPCPKAVVEQLRAHTTQVAARDRTLEITVAQESDLDLVLPVLQAAGIGLRRLEAKQMSLEAVFLDQVKRPDKEAP